MDRVLAQWMGSRGLGQPQVWAGLSEALGATLPLAWREHVQLCRVAGAEVSIAVDSAPLLAELKSFHAARLKVALQAAAPAQGLRRVRFLLARPAGGYTDVQA
jgi:hypothetical protein